MVEKTQTSKNYERHSYFTWQRLSHNFVNILCPYISKAKTKSTIIQNIIWESSKCIHCVKENKSVLLYVDHAFQVTLTWCQHSEEFSVNSQQQPAHIIASIYHVWVKKLGWKFWWMLLVYILFYLLSKTVLRQNSLHRIHTSKQLVQRDTSFT